MTAPAPIPSPHELVAEHAGWVRALAGRLVRDVELADELAQETCLAALARPPRERGDLRAWFAAVLRRQLALARRRGARRDAREREVARAERVESTHEVVSRAAGHRRLVEALTELEEPFRTAVLLRYLDGLGPQEIAARLDVPLDTARSRLRRGLERLRERLDARSEGGRREWLAAFAPLVSARDLSTGALLMQARFKLTLVAALALGGVFLARTALERGEAPEAGPALEVAAAPAAEERARLAPDAPVRSMARVEAGTTPAAEHEDPAAPAADHALAGIALDWEARPLAGLALLFEGADGERIALETDARGRVEARVASSTGTLRCADEQLVTLFTGHYDAQSASEPVVVVAPGLALTGEVVDLAGRPLADAELRVAPPADFEHRFPRVLDAARPQRFVARSDDAGAFDLGRVAALPGARFVATEDGCVPHERDLPALDPSFVRVVLERSAPEGQALRGRVLDAAGDEAPGALVAAAGHIVHAGEEGEFLFPPEVARRAQQVVALRPGALPARAGAATSADGACAWPDFVELRLGDPPLALSGRVVDELGEPVRGARVWLVDPTPFGEHDDKPSSVEAHLAGLPSQEAMLAAGGSVSGEPSSSWSFVAADERGRFRIDGLTERPYRLRAMDLASGVLVELGPFEAGAAEVELVLPLDSGTSLVTGVVRDPLGAPIEGASVRLLQRAFRVEREDGGSVAWDHEARATVSDAQGAFTLERAPRAGRLYVGAAGFSTRRFDLPLDDPLEVGLDPSEQRVHLRIELGGDPARADAFELLDEDGARVELLLARGTERSWRDTWQLAEGRSLVLSAPAGRYRLVLLNGGVEVERRLVTLVPGEVNELRP